MRPLLTLQVATLRSFLLSLVAAESLRPLIKTAVSSVQELADKLAPRAPIHHHGVRLLSHPGRCYLTTDGLSGFAITSQGELVGLFSAVGGRGHDLVNLAVSMGARRLDCFDGHLTQLYEAHGFTITRREANWVQGCPDVCYMVHK